MVHEQNLPDTSKSKEALDATTDSRTRDRNDVMEISAEMDAGQMVNPSTSKYVARPINAMERLGYTSLHDAARDNAYAAVTVLLENDADVNARDKYGYPGLALGGMAQRLCGSRSIAGKWRRCQREER